MANTAKGAPKKVLLTPKFRVSFPEVWEKRSFQEGQTGRYSCVALFQPSEFTEKDKAKWQAIIGACNVLAREHAKKPNMKEAKDLGWKVPFHKGEEKQYAGYGPGIIYFTMSAYTSRPGILDRDGNRITQDGAEEFYAGCYARASVNPFVNAKWKSIAIGMNNLQKLADGARLDARTNAEDDFGDDPAEYGDEDMGVADDGSEFGDDPAA